MPPGRRRQAAITQPWTFILVNDPITKSRVRTAAEAGERGFYEGLPEDRKTWYTEKGLSWRKPMLEEAPVLIVIASDTTKPNFRPSAWIAVAYAILALEERSLATVTYTPSDPEKVKQTLGAPEGTWVETVPPVGYTADPKPKETRKSLADVTRLNNWSTPLSLESWVDS